MSQAEIDKCFNVNLHGPIHMVRAAVPHMSSGGRIINISSIAWKMGFGVCSMYCAAKAGLDALSMAWAQEVRSLNALRRSLVADLVLQFGKSHGITVNSIAPGPVRTDINAEYADQFFGPMVEQTRAAARIGAPEDIADIALYIASEKSRWITGHFLSASGGITVG